MDIRIVGYRLVDGTDRGFDKGLNLKYSACSMFFYKAFFCHSSSLLPPAECHVHEPPSIYVEGFSVSTWSVVSSLGVMAIIFFSSLMVDYSVDCDC
jgi:hypothetical protein